MDTVGQRGDRMTTNHQTERVLIWGVGSYAKLASAMIEECHGIPASNIIFFDPDATHLKNLGNSDVLQSHEELKSALPNIASHVVAIGNSNGNARLEIGRWLEELGLEPMSVISESARITKSVQIGKGVVVMPGATINHFCEIGDYSIVNTNASIDHECFLGPGVHVMGAAAIAGRVTIGSTASIGTNATVLPDLKIGANALIGAGSVVTKNISENLICFGNPALNKGTHQINSTYPNQAWFEKLMTGPVSHKTDVSGHS